MPDPTSPAPPSGSPKDGFDSRDGAGDSPVDGSDSSPAAGSDAHPDGESDGEVEALITPRAAVLDELQVTEDEFEWALGRCLDLLEDGPDDEDDAALEDLEIVLNGRTFRLEEVAEIEISGDLSELGPLPELPNDEDPFAGEEE
ncbi:hypothetical protein [Alienimonas chondri]|uniref:Uncharacterized protein n=1 Tax=Alienimonas chondri TaxID=2681879 RepID=A0ABX1VG12_9PLAN|nr:hypothetical protein [Alienimonas chondri]NNJ26689.1 hypothetical protein [Alienimonas chondri]